VTTWTDDGDDVEHEDETSDVVVTFEADLPRPLVSLPGAQRAEVSKAIEAYLERVPPTWEEVGQLCDRWAV
jgi:hypothetical protein